MPHSVYFDNIIANKCYEHHKILGYVFDRSIVWPFPSILKASLPFIQYFDAVSAYKNKTKHQPW